MQSPDINHSKIPENQIKNFQLECSREDNKIIASPKPVYAAHDQFSFLCLLQLISSLVMNILCTCFSTIGMIIFIIACFTYHPDADEYIWTHVSIKFNNKWIQILDINEENYAK